MSRSSATSTQFNYPAPFATFPSDKRLQRVLDALPLGLAVLDDHGRVVECNDAFLRTVDCACPRGQVLPEGITVADDAPLLQRVVHDAINGGKLPVELRLRVAKRPDEPMVVTISHAPGGIGGTLLLAVRDIREQLRLEQQVAQVTRMQAIGQLAGGVAHDFNNILTANLGLIEQLLARHGPGDVDHNDLEELRANDARGAALIRQLLAFARQQTLRLQLVDAPDAIVSLGSLLRRLLGEKVELILELAPVGPIRVDPGQLEQVIVNLAVNARDAMPDGGRVVISTRSIAPDAVAALGHRVMSPGDYVQISVADSGTGIPTEFGGKIYEPFFTTKAAGKGTGLGLSTVYGVVKQSGGFVFYAPASGGGTVFTLYFPLSRGVVQAPAPRTVTVEPSPGRRLNVLLVEDDRSARMVLQRALTSAGFAVTVAADAHGAMPLIDNPATVIDVLVSDVMMPDIDGGQLAVYARSRRPGLPVLLMSGYSDPPQRSATADSGVGFLAKPFSGASLAAAIRTAAGSSGA